MFIAIGVLLLILAVLSVFLFLLFRFGKQLKVKKPLPHQKEVKIESENKSNFNAHVKQKKEEGEIISLKEVILELSTELRELMDTNDSKLNVAIESVLKPKIEKWEEEFNQRFTEHIENKLNDKFQINKRDTEQLNDKSMIYTFFQELRKFMSEKTDQSKGMPIVHDEKNQSEDQLVSNRQKLEEMWSAETFDSLRNHIDKLQVNIKNNSFFDRCYKLEQHLTFDKDLGSAYKNTLNPLREYDKKITKIMNIPKLISTDPGIQLKVPTLEKRIQMIKNSMDFLCSLEEPSIVTLILGFNIEKWVKEEFWDIADQFYRKYQMRIFKEKKASEMEEARTAIDQILAEFKLKVVPIEIGRTHFDSNLHNGTSNTKESVMSDLVISGIVHNGLQEISGVVLKQPEVIVNVL
ncbi:MAG TPA: hypothetical protein VK469_10380 [Candidatus Kapabacteria bacterium]|nr:hypothetical protein [Candidatus Kapabacteria bacterium]